MSPRPSAAPRRLAAVACIGGTILLPGCASLAYGPAGRTSPVPPHVHALIDARQVDSIVSPLAVARGASAYTLVSNSGPWRAAVLELDLTCTALTVAKGATTAAGRHTTSALLAMQPATRHAIGAVNADFFLFAPPGVPTNVHVEGGTVIAGPDGKPAMHIDAARRAHIDTLVAKGTLRDSNGVARPGTQSLTLSAWNRPSPRTSGIVDARWGVPLDTGTRRQVWRLEPLTSATRETARQGRYVVQRGMPRDTLVAGDTLLMHVATSQAPFWQSGDTLVVDMAIHSSSAAAQGASGGIHEAVSGRPILVRDSALTADVRTEGNAGFQGPNPRTAVGFSRDGRRAWLVVVDGRQRGRSMGMSLTQTGELLRMLGATEALNLDGGGSSALVVRDPDTGAGLLRNTPSDGSERPVGNALIASARCGG